MNHQKIYNQIIERAKIRNLESYGEKHHIIPKCLGGLNNKENIVKLTAKEHFICHRLLTEIYPKEPKLHFALWMMNIKSNNQQRYTISARVYERLKIEYISFRKGRKSPKSGNRTIRTKEQREKQSKQMLGRYHSDKTKEKCRKINLGKKLSEETKEKISKANRGKTSWNKGKPVSEETKQKLRKINSGRKLSEEIIKKRGTRIEKNVKHVEMFLLY